MSYNLISNDSFSVKSASEGDCLKAKRIVYFTNSLGPVYTWRTLTGVKLNNNWTQYAWPAIFWQRNQDTEPVLH